MENRVFISKIFRENFWILKNTQTKTDRILARKKGLEIFLIHFLSHSLLHWRVTVEMSLLRSLKSVSTDQKADAI